VTWWALPPPLSCRCSFFGGGVDGAPRRRYFLYLNSNVRAGGCVRRLRAFITPRLPAMQTGASVPYRCRNLLLLVTRLFCGRGVLAGVTGFVCWALPSGSLTPALTIFWKLFVLKGGFTEIF